MSGSNPPNNYKLYNHIESPPEVPETFYAMMQSQKLGKRIQSGGGGGGGSSSGTRRPSSTAYLRQSLPKPILHEPEESSLYTFGKIMRTASEHLLSSFTNIVQVAAREESIRAQAGSLQNELERFYLWAHGSSLSSNSTFFSDSDELGLSILARLYELGTVLMFTLAPAINKLYTSSQSAFKQVGKQPTLHILDIARKYLQDEGQEFVSYGTFDGVDAFTALASALEDIQALIDCLMDLGLAISEHSGTAEVERASLRGSKVATPQPQSTTLNEIAGVGSWANETATSRK